MGASGLTTMLFGFISVATFLYVSLLCVQLRSTFVPWPQQWSNREYIAVGPLQA